MSMHPAFGRVGLSPRWRPPARSGRPSQSIRTIWSVILMDTPVTSFGRTGSCRAGRRPVRRGPPRPVSVTKGSDLLVAALENEGVECIFAIPGEENLDVLESLRRSSIRLVLTRHEQAGGFMAATYGRLTGRAGVCLTTLGPGALNLATSAAYAHLGAMPMVMITGQKAIRSSRAARLQIVDIVATTRPLTKMATQIVSAQSIPTLVRDAFRVAQQERPGPVHLELTEDIAAGGAAAHIIPP